MTSIAEFDKITTPTPATSPAAILEFAGNYYGQLIDGTTGHTVDFSGRSTFITAERGLDVVAYKRLFLVMRQGIAAGDTALIDKALLGLETLLSYRSAVTIAGEFYDGPAGSFPAHLFGNHNKRDQYHNKTITLDWCSLALLQLRGSIYNTGARATRLEALLPQLAECAYWAADPATGNLDAFLTRCVAGNQVVTVAGLLEKAGLLLGDPSLRALAVSVLQHVIDARTNPDGTVQEQAYRDGVGFDGAYQLLSLEVMAETWLTLDPGPFRDLVLEQIRLGATSWQRTVNLSSGLISTIDWTRDKEFFPRGPASLEFRYAAVAWRVHFLRYILGDAVVPVTLADRIKGVGQFFAHQQKELDEPEDDPVILNMVILGDADAAAVAGVSTTAPWRALRPIRRLGGGNCAAYPGGVLPDPVFILPQSVSYNLAHIEHAPRLLALPFLDTTTPGFPGEYVPPTADG